MQDRVIERVAFTAPPFLGIRHLLSTVRCTIDGFKACFKSEVAFRQEVFIGVINLIAIVVLPLQITSRLYMVTLWFLLICVELLNSSIECVVNLASPEWHELAKRAKDYGSAAVFCILLVFFGSWAVFIGSLVYSVFK